MPDELRLLASLLTTAQVLPAGHVGLAAANCSLYPQDQHDPCLGFIVRHCRSCTTGQLVGMRRTH